MRSERDDRARSGRGVSGALGDLASRAVRARMPPRVRWLGGPALGLALRVAAGVLAVALFAGAVRVLPILLAPSAPARLFLPLARGVAAVALETALFVAPPVAFAVAAAARVERGEALALAALGARPLGLVLAAAPVAVGLALLCGAASFAWGVEARAPGRLARELLGEARAACLAAPPPAAAEVPLLGIAWVCLPGEPPRAVAAAPIGSGAAFAASAVEIADDLRAVRLADLELVVALTPNGPAPSAKSTATLHARSATLAGVAPSTRASSLVPLARAALFFETTLLLASFAAFVVLAWSIRSRAVALALGMAGPAAALAALPAFERAPNGATWVHAAVPILGVGATALVAVAFAIARRLDCSDSRRVVRVGSR